MPSNPEASIDQFIDNLERGAEQSKATLPPGPIVDVLKGFCDKLNRLDFVRGVVEPGPVPWIVHLATYPRYQPVHKSIMLVFHFPEGNEEEVVVDRGEPMNAQELWSYLDDFLRHSRFPDTLADYQMMASEDVAAELKLAWYNGVAPDDVVVTVSAEDQVRLIHHWEERNEEPIAMRVELIRPFPLGKYHKNKAYRFLESKGVVLRVHRHELEDDANVLHLEGVVVPRDQVDALA